MTPASESSFDALAPDYDRYRVGYADELFDGLREYGLACPGRVLDVGCGTGLASAPLDARGCSVVGVDPSEPMLARARERVPAAVFENARAERLPFAAASFDGAVSAQAFHWFEQPQALRELNRVVRPGGTVAIWWKALMRGDATRLMRDEVAYALGYEPPPDLLTLDFSAFEDSPFVDRRLRVIPWFVTTTVADYVGYERSRRRAHDAFGSARDEYLARLEARLGTAQSELSLGYVHLLYLGRVAEEARA